MKLNIPEKYQYIVEGYGRDEDGYWIYLNEGWTVDGKGLLIIHEKAWAESFVS